MEKYFFLWLYFACLLYTQVATAAVIEIEDAPIEDAKGSAKNSIVNPSVQVLYDNRRQTLLYARSIMDYTHIKSTANPVMVNNGLVRTRSGALQLNGEMTYKPAQTWTLKGDVQAQYSTAFDKSTPLYEQGAQDWLRLNELFVEYYPDSAWSVLLGKYRRMFGPGVFQNPMDRHNPVNSMPGQALQREGTYLGQISFEHNYHLSIISDMKISLAVLPGFYQDKNGLPSGNVSTLSFDDTKPPNSSLVVSTRTWTDTRLGGFVRLYGNVLSGDANLIYYYSGYQSQWGISYARYFTPWMEFHSEALKYERPHYVPVSGESAANAYTDFLVGARLEYDQDRGIILEYLHQGEQPKAFAQDLKNQRLLITRLLDPESHRLFLTPLQNYLLSSLYLRNIRDTYNVTANAIFGLSQVEVMFSLRGDMKVGAQASIALTAAYTAGERTSYYSAAVANDFLLSAEMQITF